MAENNSNLLYSAEKSVQSEHRLIILTYKGYTQNIQYKFSFVGKGVTFDTRGLNLKATNSIEDMYLENHGPSNALAIFKLVVEQTLPLNLVCIMYCAENSIDSKSYKPSDIIKSYKRLTMELNITDEEGLFLICKDSTKPKHQIDLAN